MPLECKEVEAVGRATRGEEHWAGTRAAPLSPGSTAGSAGPPPGCSIRPGFGPRKGESLHLPLSCCVHWVSQLHQVGVVMCSGQAVSPIGSGWPRGSTFH